MADTDYNVIKPVESLQNVAGLTPAGRREERRRRRDLQKKKKQEFEQDASESGTQPGLSNELAEEESDRHSIDYCA
ncbi:MAG TPA: hypothetical protein VMW16_00625 [Sedimentisphaerales bacterium]|nr:hypothetical protein [Sedimentisphaerales bacterium]